MAAHGATALSERPHVRTQVLPAQTTAVVRGLVPPADVPNWLKRAHRYVSQTLARQGRLATGPLFARYTDRGDRIEVEAGVPTDGAVVANGRISPSGLPAATVAVTVHQGGYAGLDAAYEQLDWWLADRALLVTGPHWERYPADGIIEIVLPYAVP